MKTIIFILLSMVFIYGCESPNFPKTLDGDVEWPKYRFTKYLATIEVKTDQDNPCTSAMAIIDFDKFYADSVGILYLDYITEVIGENENPITIEVLTTVYKDTSNSSMFWEGEIQFVKSNTFIGPYEWPHPQEVVFPE